MIKAIQEFFKAYSIIRIEDYISKVDLKQDYILKKEHEQMILNGNNIIHKLENDIESLREEIVYYTEKLDESNSMYSKLYQKYVKNNKHATFDGFVKWLDDNVDPVVKYYTGGGNKFRPSRKLRYTQQEEILAWDFINNELEFNHQYYGATTPDNLVFRFNKLFADKFPSSRYYITDKVNYAAADYWASFTESLEKLKRGKLGDCDDFMIFKYVCLHVMLKKYFSGHEWRLRGFLASLRSGGAHAILAWLKAEDMNDWIHIETTFAEYRFEDDWKRNLPLSKQLFYDIWYSFDQENEYMKLQ